MLEITLGDLTDQQVEALVNAANPTLLGGGGVDGAIHRAAGPQLRAACSLLGGCETGQVKSTPGFELWARYVIHAVGPIWQGGQAFEDVLLASCYRAALAEGVRLGVRTIAFPSISTGAYGYPLALAATVALAAITDWLATQPHSYTRVRLVCYDTATLAAYQAAEAALGN